MLVIYHSDANPHNLNFHASIFTKIPNPLEVVSVCGSSFSLGNKFITESTIGKKINCHLYWPLNSKFIQGTPLSSLFNQFNSHKYSSLLNKYYNITSQHISNNPSQIQRTRMKTFLHNHTQLKHHPCKISNSKSQATPLLPHCKNKPQKTKIL